MSYEMKLGWRYLYSGKFDRWMLALSGGAALMCLIGLTILVGAGGGSTLGVLMFEVGLVSTAVFALMAIFSVFVSVSVFGVALGVAALTVVLAVTTGFQKQFRDKVLGVNAHVIVLKNQHTFFEYRETMETAKNIDPDVLAVQPFIFAEMLVTRGLGDSSGVAIKGIDPKLFRGVLDLEKHMIAGSVDSLAIEPKDGELSPIILGKQLASKLKAKVGDTVTVVVPLSNLDQDTGKAVAPRTHKFRITGIFYSGFDEYDRRLMYTSLVATQALVGRGDQVMGIEMKVRDVDRAADIARKLERKLKSTQYQVQDWYELNHNLFTALNLQKIVLVVILFLIIIVAAVNMVSALIMMVTDKTREIAILKSMGSTSSSVAGVFQVVGLAIGGVGTVIGIGIGLSTCYVMSSYGYRLDPKVYLIDRLPIEVKYFEVLIVAGVTMIISAVATLVPASNASALRPVDGLRYD